MVDIIFSANVPGNIYSKSKLELTVTAVKIMKSEILLQQYGIG